MALRRKLLSSYRICIQKSWISLPGVKCLYCCTKIHPVLDCNSERSGLSSSIFCTYPVPLLTKNSRIYLPHNPKSVLDNNQQNHILLSQLIDTSFASAVAPYSPHAANWTKEPPAFPISSSAKKAPTTEEIHSHSQSQTYQCLEKSSWNSPLAKCRQSGEAFHRQKTPQQSGPVFHRMFHYACIVSNVNEANRQDPTQAADGKKDSSESQLQPIVLYRGKWMRTFRLLVRLKVIQLVGVAAIALPIAQYTQEGSLPLSTIAAVGLVLGGAGAASAALWYYSSRYIGELALLPPDYGRVRISVLDFWGQRQEIAVQLRDVVPPLGDMSKAELAVAAQQVLLPLDVVGLRQFVLSIRHGRLINRDVLLDFLRGNLDPKKLASSSQMQQAAEPVDGK